MLGFASDVISYEPKYEKVFSSLLGKTLLADTMDTGSAVARKYGHRLRIVCLDGTQFNAGGSLTGGSTRNQEGSLISRRALLQELQETCRCGQQRLEALLAEGKDLRQQAEGLNGTWPRPKKGCARPGRLRTRPAGRPARKRRPWLTSVRPWLLSTSAWKNWKRTGRYAGPAG